MSLDSLMEAVEKAPVTGKNEWTIYRPHWWKLREEKKMSQAAAAKFIAEHEGLSADEQQRLHYAGKNWENYVRKGGKAS